MSTRVKFAKARMGQGLYGNSDAVDFDEAWNILRSSLQEIHGKNASQLSFEELYRHAYKLVLKKKGDLLYEKVKNFEETWLADTVQPRITSTLATGLLIPGTEGGSTFATTNEKRAEGEKLLRSLKEAWEDHNLCMNMITDVLMYMVRSRHSGELTGLAINGNPRNVFTAKTSGNHRSSLLLWANSETLYYEYHCTLIKSRNILLPKCSMPLYSIKFVWTEKAIW